MNQGRITDQNGKPGGTPARTPSFVQVYREDEAALREELRAGLMAAQPQVSPKFLYDALGSRLFEAITELPEYYPTRTEAAILAEHGAEIAAVVPRGATLIDLGAGNCNKAASLFERFAPARYLAVDISVDFLRNAIECLQRQHPTLEMWGLGTDFSRGLQLPDSLEADITGPRLLFYPGSSIGNFTPPQALAFLESVRQACRGRGGAGRGEGRREVPGAAAPSPNGLLIGVDLVKDTTTLEAAYDDPLGVTAAFNLNLLQHLNRLLGTDFRLTDWRHLARYDTALNRIEMHLQARRSVVVRWPDGNTHRERRFMAGQTLHTENSCKWTIAGFETLLMSAGFGPPRHWTDAQSRFAVFWAPA